MRKLVALAALYSIFLASSLAIQSAAAQPQQPGNSFDTATEIEKGEHTFYLDAGTIHYFKLKLDKGVTFLLTMRVPSDQDIDLVLFDPDRDVVEIAQRPTGATERIGHIAAQNGEYFVAVFGFAGSFGVYSLQISVVHQPFVTQTRLATATITQTATSTQIQFVTLTVQVTTTSTTTSTSIVESLSTTLTGVGLVILSISLFAAATRISSSLRRQPSSS